MSKFNKGDILTGTKRKFKEAYHPVVFMDGPESAPMAVVLTHSDEYPCNKKLTGSYGKKTSYFVAHLIKKLSKWGPYKNNGQKLTKGDIKLIEASISGNSITWEEYEEYTNSGSGCPDHSNLSAQEASK